MTAVFDIDLGAFTTNVARVRAAVAPALLMLVVKDDAYGHGLERIVTCAWAEGVTWFGAFDVRTGAAVRRFLGEDARIFVWIAASDAEIRECVETRLDIGIGDAALLEDVARTSAALETRARVHLKIDTGLHRNGVRPEDWREFVRRAAALQRAGSIAVEGIWSHIAEASDAEDDAAQRLFEEAMTEAELAGLHPVVRHLAASAAAFARPGFRYDLVRVGAFCFGIASADSCISADDLGLRPIGSLRTRVSAVDEETVHIGVGYLDGLPSTLAGRADVGTPGGARRILQIHSDESVISSWPGAAIGDAIVIFGPPDAGIDTATGLAEKIGTIGEEIVVRLSPLVPRNYL